jgi:glycosyltransferase involved in cell wall biosynthesis
MVGGHRALGTWDRAVDAYYTPSEFARRKFIQAGFDPDRIAVKPNCVFPDPGPGSGAAGGVVFLGRLAPEKGIEILLNAWLGRDLNVPLAIIGDGPMAPQVQQAAARCDRIRWLGHLPLREALRQVGEASLLVSPSIAYETFGRSVVEAFAKGTPVLASDGGASAELIREGQTGLHFRAGDADDLAQKVRRLMNDPALLSQMRGAARDEYLQKYNGDMNYRALIAIYEQAITRRAALDSAAAQHVGALGALTAAVQSLW